MPFLAPDPRQRPSVYTECYACGARKGQHGPKDECPCDLEPEKDQEPSA
jgi:hypothetical protein